MKIIRSLIDHLGSVIEAYDEAHMPKMNTTGVDVLRLLMEANAIKQPQLPGVGRQPIVSEVLCGKRQLSWRQVQALVHRFNVSTDVFCDP